MSEFKYPDEYENWKDFSPADGTHFTQDAKNYQANLPSTLKLPDNTQFNSAIPKVQIAIFKNGNNLEIAYQLDTQDKITVTNQLNTAGQIERFKLGTGQYMTKSSYSEYDHLRQSPFLFDDKFGQR